MSKKKNPIEAHSADLDVWTESIPDGDTLLVSVARRSKIGENWRRPAASDELLRSDGVWVVHSISAAEDESPQQVL